MQALEALECTQRVGNLSQIALTDRQQVQNVAILGDFIEESSRGSRTLCELPRLD
jgi:hypothetical protein